METVSYAAIFTQQGCRTAFKVPEHHHCFAAMFCSAAKIVTGSLQGVLRVHLPHQRGYHVEDMLLETELEGSILQLAAGNFLG